MQKESINGRVVVFMKHKDVSEGKQCHQCAYYDSGTAGMEDIDCPRERNGSGDLVCDTSTDSVWQYVEEPLAKPVEASVGRKYDAGKPMWGLLPPDALEEVVKVLTAGSIKYNEPADQENWRLVDNPQFRYFNAAQRHIYADKRGELIDIDKGESKGTNCYHLACAIASLMFMLQLKMEENK